MVMLATMSSVTAMHKEMHEKAAQQEDEWEIRCNMLAMVYDEVETDDHEKSDKCPANSLVFHIISSSALAYKF